MDKGESLGMIIRKVTDNIEIVMNGGKLIDNIGDEITIVRVVVQDKNDELDKFTLEELAEFIEFIEPKTDREIALELEIAGLRDQLKAAGSVVMGSSSKPRKIPVTLSEAQELIVVDYYLANKDEKIKIKDIAAKYNISDNKVSDILYKAGVRIPGKRNRKVTYAE